VRDSVWMCEDVQERTSISWKFTAISGLPLKIGTSASKLSGSSPTCKTHGCMT
jgi:hypothetical protein